MSFTVPDGEGFVIVYEDDAERFRRWAIGAGYGDSYTAFRALLDMATSSSAGEPPSTEA